MSQPYIDQLFKGKVKQLGDPNAEKRINRQWETGMFKKPTEEKIWLSETGLIGDEVGDKKNHGGPERSFKSLNHDVRVGNQLADIIKSIWRSAYKIAV